MAENENLDDYFRGKRSLRWWAGDFRSCDAGQRHPYIGTTGQAYWIGQSFIQVYLPQPL